jgi:SAM-dependent methyltransferase
VPSWKAAERQHFLELLRSENRRSLIDIGAGTGVHAQFFEDAGIDVVCTDLSSAMVEHCQAAGLEAHQQDMLHLDLGRRFDAAFAMNCLLHVPPEDFSDALASIRSVLEPGGLFYLGQYGGINQAGVLEGDSYEPKRYFSWLTDDELLTLATAHFTVVSFAAVDIGSTDGVHLQSAVLRA